MEPEKLSPKAAKIWKTVPSPVASAHVTAGNWVETPKRICHEKYDDVRDKTLDQCKSICSQTAGCTDSGFSYVQAWKACRIPKPNVPCQAGAYSQGAFYKLGNWVKTPKRICHEKYDDVKDKTP